MHIPGMAFENRPTGPGRGLRRLATRVSGTRGRRREPAAAPGRTADNDNDNAGAVGAPPGQRPVRPDPVLRWKNPSEPPQGNFTSCAVPNAQLKVHGIPEHGDSWDAVSSFSLSYDGYAYWDDVSELATRSIRVWTRDHALPATIDEVRACLFYEQRRWHHFGEDPNGRGAHYVWALLDTLRSLVAAQTVGTVRTVQPLQTVPTVHGPRPTDPLARSGPSGPSGAATRTPAAVRSFLDDDPGYLAWAAEHNDGFVVNADRTLSPNSLMLHCASCSCIGGPAAGGRTRTANYRKVCGSNLDALVDWCRNDIGVEPPRCRHCRPLP